MKRIYAALLGLTVFIQSAEAQTVVIDTATLGAGSANDVYYRIQTYEGTTAPGQWDIALSAQKSLFPNDVKRGASVRINGGRGVVAMKIANADQTGFATVFNPATDSATWKMLRDDMTNWDIGAFNTTADAANNFDFGWGLYSMGSHDINGDSIYAVRTVNGNWKKVWFETLDFDSTWHVTVADMNGANQHQYAVNKDNYAGKNYVYLALDNNAVMDNEPTEWDLLFTKYHDYVTLGGQSAWYSVNGVLINKGVTAVKAYPVDINTVASSAYTGTMIPNINAIGWDWKTFTGTYVMEDSLVYFVKALDNNVYRLRFLSFASSNVETVFELVSGSTGVSDAQLNNSSIVLYPNPATDRLAVIQFDEAFNAQYRVVDTTGKTVQSGNAHGKQTVLDISQFAAGMYVVQFITPASVQSKSFVVNR